MYRETALITEASRNRNQPSPPSSRRTNLHSWENVTSESTSRRRGGASGDVTNIFFFSARAASGRAARRRVGPRCSVQHSLCRRCAHGSSQHCCRVQRGSFIVVRGCRLGLRSLDADAEPTTVSAVPKPSSWTRHRTDSWSSREGGGHISLAARAPHNDRRHHHHLTHSKTQLHCFSFSSRIDCACLRWPATAIDLIVS